jgi:hypothetical protein
MRAPRLLLLVVALLTVSLTFSALAGANKTDRSKLEVRLALAEATHAPPSLLPVDGVYTCGWIAEHPIEAAQAMVSCTPTPPRNLVLGNSVGPLSVETYPHCHYLPEVGKVGQGVFAWSHYEYAYRYDINAFYAGYYTWYIQKTDGTNQYWRQVINTLDTQLKELPANVRRSGAQNHSSTPERFLTCFDFE